MSRSHLSCLEQNVFNNIDCMTSTAAAVIQCSSWSRLWIATFWIFDIIKPQTSQFKKGSRPHHLSWLRLIAFLATSMTWTIYSSFAGFPEKCLLETLFVLWNFFTISYMDCMLWRGFPNFRLKSTFTSLYIFLAVQPIQLPFFFLLKTFSISHTVKCNWIAI